MMNAATLELSQELYELSGWKDTEFCYYANGGEVNPDIVHYRQMVFNKPLSVPAYDLGYLLRKLPQGVTLEKNNCRWEYKTQVWWEHIEELNTNVWREADTPEDAACKLAIELFKQGILTYQPKD